jgi:hypothetical protein
LMEKKKKRKGRGRGKRSGFFEEGWKS